MKKMTQVGHLLDHPLQLGHIIDEDDDADEAFGSEKSPTTTSPRRD